MVSRLLVVDSHTGGEPTRVVIEGFPKLNGSTIQELRDDFRERFDYLRRAILAEPRGSEILVGAVLLEPVSPANDFAVIFFNNVGILGMCGHGTIGLIETLRHLKQIVPGDYRVETPAGTVRGTLHTNGTISIINVPSFRTQANISVRAFDTDYIGDVAYGGNWFFLVKSPSRNLLHEEKEILSNLTLEIMKQLAAQNVTGPNGEAIDHVELFCDSNSADSKNFVMCPGGEFDRSPCGTGTSAKLACLFADGKLQPGQIWRQESITGSVFEGSVQIVNHQVIPVITGTAFITAETTLHFSDNDPLRWGLPN